MSEVSCRAVIPVIDALREMGGSTEGLFDDLSVSCDTLSRPSNRISWDDYLVLLERSVAALGGVDQLESVIRRLPKKMGIVRAIAVDLLSIRTIYNVGTKWYGRSLFLNTRGTLENLPDGRIREVVEILPGYRDSEVYFRVLHAFLRGAPAAIGMQDVDVTMELEPRRAIYTISLPPELTFSQRVRALFTRRTANRLAEEELLAVNQEVWERYVRSNEDRSALAEKSSVLETLNRASRELVRHDKVGDLADAILQIIDQEFAFDGVALISTSQKGDDLELIRLVGRTTGAPTRVCLLRLGEAVVGRLHLWHWDEELSSSQQELLEDLLLWFAVALNNVQILELRTRQKARLEVAIATQKRAEERLNRMGKMEALGNIASMVAHDFNNTLAAVRTYAELAQQRVATDKPVERELEGILAVADRGASLIKQILAFKRTEMPLSAHVDVNEVIRGLAPMLRKLVGEEIDVVIQLPGPVGVVSVDPMKLEQVIINLVVNSRDAMPDGGRATIRTSFEQSDPTGVAEHGFVRIEVIDTGCGIAPELHAQIFEPFSTTKPQDKGTGLGLAIIQDTVTQASGTVEFWSEREKGTHFIIRLPRVIGCAEPERIEKAISTTAGGQETILFVEDEDHLRSGTRQTLTEMGYRVLEAADAESAIALCRSREDRIDLLLTDVGLPGVDGYELAHRVQFIHPEIRGVVYVSGFGDGEADRQRVEGCAFLPKPFTRFALLSSIRRLLDE